MTKKEMFLAIASVPAVAENAEMVEFLNHQVELLNNRKSGSGKPTAKQEANAELKTEILDLLKDGRMTCGEIAKALTEWSGEDVTGQRTSALLRQMGKDGTGEVVKTMEKKVAYFSLA